MSVPAALAIVAAAWVVLVTLGWTIVIPWLERGPGRDAVDGLLWRGIRLYARLRHHPTVEGAEIAPQLDDDHQGLIIVSNHTGVLDPVLIQASSRFWIRWMMAADMMGPSLAWLLRQQRTIPVDRNNRDSASLREAIRFVRGGGALGIFPEGRITMPPRELRPFLPGVGMIIAKSRVPVLLVWVSGTPETNKMNEALMGTSHSRVVYVDLIDFGDERDAAKITERLRARLAEVSGWPLNDEVLPIGGPPPEEPD